MKSHIIATFCLVIALPTLANWRDECGSIGSFAENVMVARQEGISMQSMMEAIKESEKGPSEVLEKNTEEIAEIIIISAFEEPQFSSKERQQRNVNIFRDKIYL